MPWLSSCCWRIHRGSTYQLVIRRTARLTTEPTRPLSPGLAPTSGGWICAVDRSACAWMGRSRGSGGGPTVGRSRGVRIAGADGTEEVLDPFDQNVSRYHLAIDVKHSHSQGRVTALSDSHH